MSGAWYAPRLAAPLENVCHASVILQALRKVVSNIEPRRFTANEYVTPGFDARIGVECSERKAIDLWSGIEFGVKARPTVGAEALVLARGRLIERQQLHTLEGFPVRSLNLGARPES